MRSSININKALIYTIISVMTLLGLISCGNDENYGGNAQAHNHEGWKHFSASHYQEALQFFNKAIAADPKLAEAYTNRAMAKCMLYEYESALTDWEIYLTFEKNIFVMHQNEYNRAKEMIEKLKTDPKACYRRADEKRNIDNFKGAIADFDKAIELDPEYAEAYIARGGTKEKLGDFSGAIEDYEESIRLKPQWESQIRPLINKAQDLIK
jgi:tetratricopeptide (TPR) repeat protein